MLAETEALIRQRELEHEAAERLVGDRFISEAELAGKFAELVAARAARERIALDIEHTWIRAPFDGVVYERLVEIGDYVAIGDPIAQIVDANPLIIVANVNERSIGGLTVGSTGRARVLGGPEITGEIRYLSPVADESTRSFRVELAIPNPDASLPVGTSAELMLGAESIVAHEVSSALLALADDGTIGVKIVDASSRVRFVPVEIVESTDNGGMLVTGLPAEAKIITVGQGFVTDGQLVSATEDESGRTRAANERAD
jgi:multidrug efflux system membrane fusion protein